MGVCYNIVKHKKRYFCLYINTLYDRKKYDWVLVKYFDGDYECVPEVAEKRANGKWYTSDREIPFEVKYFADIQELLEEG